MNMAGIALPLILLAGVAVVATRKPKAPTTMVKPAPLPTAPGTPANPGAVPAITGAAATIIPCVTTFSGGTTAPCVDPVNIDKALQSGPFSVQFNMTAKTADPLDGGTTYRMFADVLNADTNGPGGTRRLAVRVTGGAPAYDKRFAQVGDIVVLRDDQLISIAAQPSKNLVMNNAPATNSALAAGYYRY